MKKIVLSVLSVMLSAGFAAGVFSGCSQTGEAGKKPSVISVYNWGDYIDETLLRDFTDKTGIEVIYDTYATNEDMYTKVKNGGTNYDIIIPSDYMIEKMIKEDMLEKINFDNIPNMKNTHERFLNLDYDKTGEYSVPYMWGTLGILYNTEMVDEVVDSWNIMWDNKYAGQIFMYDSMRDSLAAALKKLGYSLNTTDLAELNEAKQILIDQKPLVAANVGDLVKDKMIGNEGALALVYSGDAVYCMEENEALAYAVPEEGSNVWVDGIVIPKGSKNKEGAEAFIDFMCEPEVALKNTEYIGYSTTNKGAYELLPDEIKDDPVYWPSDEVYEKCQVFVDLGDVIKEYDKIWTEILVGH